MPKLMRHLTLVVALAAALAGEALAAPAAMVVELGSPVTSGGKPVALAAMLPAGAKVDLGVGGKVVLIYFADSHQEKATGAGSFQVGKRGGESVRGCRLERAAPPKGGTVDPLIKNPLRMGGVTRRSAGPQLTPRIREARVRMSPGAWGVEAIEWESDLAGPFEVNLWDELDWEEGVLAEPFWTGAVLTSPGEGWRHYRLEPDVLLPMDASHVVEIRADDGSKAIARVGLTPEEREALEEAERGARGWASEAPDDPRPWCFMLGLYDQLRLGAQAAEAGEEALKRTVDPEERRRLHGKLAELYSELGDGANAERHGKESRP